MNCPPDEVGRRFARRPDRYLAAAIVQRELAQVLASDLAAVLPGHPLRALEIGCGPGTLTRELDARLEWKQLYLCELYDPGPQLRDRLDTPYQLLLGDAEDLEWPDSLDLIAAGAVFQWFRRPAHILPKAWRALRCGGHLAFSTFLPGHFAEFRAATGIGLEYPSLEQWAEWVRRDCWEIRVWEAHHRTMDFADPLAVLGHIRDTGVGAVIPYRWTKSSMAGFAARYPREANRCPLSYRAHRFVLRKPLGA